MTDKGIKIKTMNAYEVEQRFGSNPRKPLRELKEQIQEQYSADGGPITDGIPEANAAEAPGALQDAEVDAAPGALQDVGIDTAPRDTEATDVDRAGGPDEGGK